jgi:PAS domain S-box-containing protein
MAMDARGVNIVARGEAWDGSSVRRLRPLPSRLGFRGELMSDSTTSEDPTEDVASPREALALAEGDDAAHTGGTPLSAAEISGLYRLLVHSVQDYAIFLLDPQGRVASWNEGAERIKGYRADEIIGRHFSVFYPAADVEAGKTKMELEVASREGKYEEEGWRVRSDGSLFWASVLITALRDPDGGLVGFAKVTRDLTERRAAQERAIADARRIAEIETASRTKSEFLAALSHELRTPINATLGFAELLELEIHGPVTPEQREDLQRIQQSQRHLLRIISDLLNYSRIEAGQIEYEIRPVQMNEVVEAVLPMVEPQARAKELEIVHDPCPHDAVAMTDRSKTEQIVLNLLSNAVKFTPPGGRVRVGSAVSGARVIVTVEDTGPGIPREQQKSIFQPFTQLGRSLTSSHEGTGLGLSISRDLALAMGGDIRVRSAPDEGATFTLILPGSGPGPELA